MVDKLLELEQKTRTLLKEHPEVVHRFGDYLFPAVANYPEVKFGIMCLMANVWDYPNERNRIHILLHGKPGTGKTALMFPLEENWDAKYISMDPSAASLKSDARKNDRGAQIFRQYNGGVVMIDDFELMQDKNLLRDVMERGKYSDSKGGSDEEYDAYIRIIAATNDISKVPLPIMNRFDLIFPFTYPTIRQSMQIVDQMLNRDGNGVNALPMLQHYMTMVQAHEPKTVDKDRIKEVFENYFNKYGTPNELSEKSGKEGRWIATIIRLAMGKARLYLGDIGPDEIAFALQAKHKSDKIIEEFR